MTFSVFSRCDHSGYSAAPSGAKFVPGHFIKIGAGDISNTTVRNDVINYVNATPTVRGIKVVKNWGELEITSASPSPGTTGTLTGPGITDWDDLLNELNPDKFLILAIANKCFGTNPTNYMPLNMMTSTGTYTDAAGSHTTYQYMWANKNAAGAAQDYLWKMWDPLVRSRYAAFLELLAAKYDDNPRVCRIDTLESSYGTQLIPKAIMGFDSADYEAGWAISYADTTNHFAKTPYTLHMNSPRPYLYTLSLLLKSNYIGLGAPNSNLQSGYFTFNAGGPPYNRGDPTIGPIPACGMAHYYPYFTNQIMLVPEVQGDDFESSTGNKAPVVYDHPSYQSIFERCRDTYHANTIVWLSLIHI